MARGVFLSIMYNVRSIADLKWPLGHWSINDISEDVYNISHFSVTSKIEISNSPVLSYHYDFII